MRRVIAPIVVALTLAAAPAEAEFSKKVRAACSGDAKSLCPKTRANSEELRYCMEAKSTSLSKGCVRALEDDGVIPRGYLKQSGRG
jgi:hypothetical protein